MNTSVASYRLAPAELDEMHRIAHGSYLQGRYEEASRYFWFMSLHAPTDVRYLKGLGASLFMARAFTRASTAYACLLQIAPMDPEVSCMYGYTLLMLGERTQARRLLEYALRLPGAHESHGRARALLALIDR